VDIKAFLSAQSIAALPSLPRCLGGSYLNVFSLDFAPQSGEKAHIEVCDPNN
jgi:hypothetical protein